MHAPCTLCGLIRARRGRVLACFYREKLAQLGQLREASFRPSFFSFHFFLSARRRLPSTRNARTQQTTLRRSLEVGGKDLESLWFACSAPLSDSGRRSKVKEPWPHKFKYSSYFQTPALLYPRSHFPLMDGCHTGAVHLFRGVGMKEIDIICR